MEDKTKLAVQPSVSGIPEKIESQQPRKSSDPGMTIQTDVDDLIRLIEEKKQISMADASKILGVPQQTVEAWAIFLEEDGVLDVKYNFTTPYLVSKSLIGAPAPPSESRQRKNQILLGETRISAQKPESAASNVPHVLKQVSKEMDRSFARAYELIEQDSFDEVKRLYQSIKTESDSLPSELKEIKREISSNLTKLSKDLGINLEKYNLNKSKEVEKATLEKLLKMERLTSSGDLKAAEEHYAELQRLFSAFPPGFEARRSDLQTRINLSYRKLLAKKKELLWKYNQHKSGQIINIMREIRASLQQGEIEPALKKYEEARLNYTQLPDGFSEENTLLSTELFALAQEILSQKQSYSVKEFSRLLTQLKELMALCYDSLGKGNIEEADQHFNRSKEIYKQLPSNFFNKRVDVESDFLELENQLLLKSKNTRLSRLKDSISKITHLVKSAQDNLKRNEIELAEGIYYEILHIYKDMPDGFMEQKTEMSVTLLNLFREILLKYDEPVVNEFDEHVNERYSRLIQLITSIREDLGNSRFDVVESKYSEISDLFGHLPFKFVQEKTRLWQEVLALSSEIALYEKSKELDAASDNPELLKKTLSDIQVQYLRLHIDYQNNPTYSNVLTFVREKYLFYHNRLMGTNLKEIAQIPPQRREDSLLSPTNPIFQLDKRFGIPQPESEMGETALIPGPRPLPQQPNQQPIPAQHHIAQSAKLFQEEKPAQLIEEITPQSLKQNLLSSMLMKANRALQEGHIGVAEMLFSDVLNLDSFNKEAKSKLELIEGLKSQPSQETTLTTFIPEPALPVPEPTPEIIDFIPPVPEEAPLSLIPAGELEGQKAKLNLMKATRLLREIKSAASSRRFPMMDQKYNELMTSVSKIPLETIQQNAALVRDVQDLTKVVQLYAKSKRLQQLQQYPEELDQLINELRRELSEIPADSPYFNIIRNIEYKCKFLFSKISAETTRRKPSSMRHQLREEEPVQPLNLLTTRLKSLESKINQRLEPEISAPQIQPPKPKTQAIKKRPIKKLKT